MQNELMLLASNFLSQIGQRGAKGLSPWAIRQEAIAASLQMVRGLRQSNSPVAAGAFRSGTERLAAGSFAYRTGSVAVVPVYGPLTARLNGGYWSYEEIVQDLRLAEATPGVRSIVLEIDSPGGVVSGVDTVPAEIARIRQSIPVHAHIRGIGASAAYWVASAAERISAERTSIAGSIGAIIHYVDMEGILTKLGANVVEVVASQSPNKRLKADSEVGQAELQAIVDDGAEMFLEALSINRAVGRDTIMERYGQGLVFPAREALERGLIDAVATFDQVLADMAARSENSIGAASATAPIMERETFMSDPKSTGADHIEALTLEAVVTSHPEIAAELRRQGATAERERITGIEAQAAGLTGVEALVAELKADGNTTPQAAAVRLLEASKTMMASRLKGLEALDQAAAGVESPASPAGTAGASGASTPEGWEVEWNASAKLQAEYPTASSYVATMKRKAA